MGLGREPCPDGSPGGLASPLSLCARCESRARDPLAPAFDSEEEPFVMVPCRRNQKR